MPRSLAFAVQSLSILLIASSRVVESREDFVDALFHIPESPSTLVRNSSKVRTVAALKNGSLVLSSSRSSRRIAPERYIALVPMAVISIFDLSFSVRMLLTRRMARSRVAVR